MVVLILFRKKSLKFGFILASILGLAIFNLYFINYIDSSSTQNYTTSVMNTVEIQSDIIKEVQADLESKIVNWSELLANNSNLSDLSNIVSYPSNALVKVREDNKIEFILKRNAMDLSIQALELISKYNIDIYKEAPYFNLNIIYIPAEFVESFIIESKKVTGIVYTEPNFYIELDFVPNDQYYASYQWDLPLIGMESAWDHELGSHDVIVAVVDTGIDYTHPDLSENYLSLGYDWVNNDDDPMDDHYHGTHCAGTIGAIFNNAIGVAGMANVSIFTEKAFNNMGSGSFYDATLALKHAVDMGADIISCSWGGTSYSETLLEAVEYAINNGVMVIAAAGNDNSDDFHYPASYPEVIAVTATDEDDNKASFSSFGDWVDIAAPGVDIISTVPYETQGTYYKLASGTSMATPHVAGFAALLKSAFPTYNANQIESLIYDSALDLGDPGFDQYYGHGRIDATNIFGPDMYPPTYSNLIESADPLLLGNTEIITIDVTDPSGVKQVLIEFEGSNHSMSNIGGDTWRYNSWVPPTTGTYFYTIYMEDNLNYRSSVSESIEVIDDTKPPTYSNLIESADPLMLGDTEIISIDVHDVSGINQVLIEFEGSNHSMNNIGGDTWRYNSWVPPTAGTYVYTIYMEDNLNYWSSISNSIQVIIDSTPPTYSNLTEITDPLELGTTAKIGLKVSDPSGINQVNIEFEGTNHSMRIYVGLWWIYDSWIPSQIGNYQYTIFMEDNYNNWNSVSDSINVIDTTPPAYTILTNNSGPLELGNSRDIQVKAFDISGINQVLIENEGKNDTLTYLGGEVWQYKNFNPTSVGMCEYTIYLEDNNYNWASVSDSIEVRDTTTPYAPTLIKYPRGEVSGKIIFDWEDGYDPSGIAYYKLIIDNESDPLITPGNIFEFEIVNTGPESSYYELEKSLPLGNYYFFLYQIDGVGLESPSTIGTFTIISTEKENNLGILFMPILWGVLIIGSIVAIPSYVATKKIKNGKSKIFNNNFEIKYLKNEIKDLMKKKKQTEKAAEVAVRYGNYAKAARLYEECEVISNQLFKKGNMAEAESSKHYANMKSKASQARIYEASFITFSINDLISKYFDSVGIEYHTYPQIYPDGKKTINGWILNDKKILQHWLTNPKNGIELVREFGMYPENLSNISAIQFVFTDDLSYNSIVSICREHQNPNIIIIIVGINWPSNFQDRQSFAPPEDKDIIYKENIRIIDTLLFTNLIGLNGEYRESFFKIIRAYLKEKTK